MEKILQQDYYKREGNFMRKKLMSMMLIGAMAASMLAGCGNKPAENTTKGDTTATVATAEAGDSAAGTEAASGEPTKVVLEYIYFNQVPADLQKVQDAINAITVPAINVEMEYYPVSLGEADTQTSLMISSGQPLDLVVPFGQSAFLSLVNKNMVIPLDDLVTQYGPDVLKADEKTLDGGYIGGKLYGIPSIYKLGRTYGYVVRKDILDEVGWTKMEDNRMADLTELFGKIKEAHPDMSCVQMSGGTGTLDFFGYFNPVDYLGADPGCGGVLGAGLTDNSTIENIFATDEYMEYAKTLHDWYQQGYINADAATNSDTTQSAITAGTAAGFFLNTELDMVPGQSSGIGKEMVAVNTAPHKLLQQELQGQSMCIPVSCKNPEAAMKFINLMFSSDELINLFYYGIEGLDYQVLADGRIGLPEGKTLDTIGYQTFFGLYWDQMTKKVWENNPADYMDQVKTYNDEINESNTSKFIGYTFNPEEVKTKYSAVQDVIKQYRNAIETGSVDAESMVPQFISALQAAGIDEIIAANQKGLDEYMVSKSNSNGR